jgi:hypothetical protein
VGVSVEELKNIKSDLSDLRREIINYINSQESEQDLMDKFIAVKGKDEDIYELIMLIYQELKTANKMHKKKLTHIIDKTLELKIKSIDNSIMNFTQRPVATQGSVLDKVLDAKFIAKVVGIAMSVFAFLFIMYTINPQAFNNVKQSIHETVEISKKDEKKADSKDTKKTESAKEEVKK